MGKKIQECFKIFLFLKTKLEIAIFLPNQSGTVNLKFHNSEFEAYSYWPLILWNVLINASFIVIFSTAL